MFSKKGQYSPTSRISLEAWAYFTSVDENATVVKNGWNGTTPGGYGFYITDGKLRFNLNTGTDNFVDSTLEANKWYHLAGVYDGSNITLYVNGQLAGSESCTGAIVYDSDSLSCGVGMAGYLDELRVWDVAMDQDQVKTMMFQPLRHCSYEEDVLGTVDMANLRFMADFSTCTSTHTMVVPATLVAKGSLRNGAVISTEIPYDNWFPDSNTNWHEAGNWKAGVLPTSSNPGFAVLNNDTADLAGADASVNNLVIKNNASFITANDAVNKISIHGDIYHEGLGINTTGNDNGIESYSSISLFDPETSNNYTIGDHRSNAMEDGYCRGLRGYYFDEVDFSSIVTSRCDSSIDFSWGPSAPANHVTDDGAYSVRWVGHLLCPETGDYTFYLTSSGGAELWVNDQFLVNHFNEHAETTDSASVSLTAGTSYPIVINYKETDNSAKILLEWEYSGNRETIPSDKFKSFSGLVE